MRGKIGVASLPGTLNTNVHWALAGLTEQHAMLCTPLTLRTILRACVLRACSPGRSTLQPAARMGRMAPAETSTAAEASTMWAQGVLPVAVCQGERVVLLGHQHRAIGLLKAFRPVLMRPVAPLPRGCAVTACCCKSA